MSNAARATNNDITDYATVYSALSVASNIRFGLKLKPNQTGQPGDRAGVLVAPGGGFLGVSALGTYTIRTYEDGAFREAHVVSAELIQSLSLLSSQGRPVQLEFVAGKTFDEVELGITGALSLSYTLDVFYAYAVPSLVRRQARGLISRFAGSGTALRPYYGSSTNNIGLISLCAFNSISNPDRAVDNNLDNYASFASLANVSCATAFAVQLEGNVPAPAGYYAGFVIGNAGLLDLGVLSNLTITTFLNGVQKETRSGTSLLELRLLPGGKAQVSFPTTQEFNQVQITRGSLLNVLDNLNIYYGFGVEPAAFRATIRNISDFAAPTISNYAVDNNSLVCLSLSNGCDIVTPMRAVDGDTTNFAYIHSTVSVLALRELKMDLNGPAPAGNGNIVGMAGNRAGVVVGFGGGLLDVTLLNSITVTTYDRTDRMIESASGGSVLGIRLLSTGLREIYFLTTQPFSKVQLSVREGVSLLSDINVYYAFTDNRTGGIPGIIVPLPVELTAFTGKWANGAAELNWATASEKNSSHFVVERSTGRDIAFLPVGQVAAAGSSSSPKTYQLRDDQAVTLGVSVLYYRLRQVDIDGQQAFSPVVAVAVGQAAPSGAQFEVYPNPTANGQALTVRYPSLPTAGATLLTYSQLGQLVNQQPVTEATARLALPALTSGLYYVVLRDAAGQQLASQRLVVEGR